MVASSKDRRRTRRQRANEVFKGQAGAALDALALLDFAWHDCYGESSPPEQVNDEIWIGANGNLAHFISAAHLAVVDFRDLRVDADAMRREGAASDRSCRCPCAVMSISGHGSAVARSEVAVRTRRPAPSRRPPG